MSTSAATGAKVGAPLFLLCRDERHQRKPAWRAGRRPQR
jgi:hypothetical protein